MTILIRCSDPRINDYLDYNEVKEALALDNGVAVIANTGSIKYFMEKDQEKNLFEQLGILVHHFKADTITLLNHTDCGFYKSVGQDSEENYLNDLKKMKAEIAKIYPNIKINGYLMDTSSGELKSI